MAQDDQLKMLDFEEPIAELDAKIAELEEFSKTSDMDLTGQIEELRRRHSELVGEIFEGLTPWQRVQLARHPERPNFADYRERIVRDWLELHGDRSFGDDDAMATGFGRIDGEKVLVVAHRKGRTTRERVSCNFGSAHPEGYRKAIRKMRLAAKLDLPIVTLIDTPGAYPGIGAEERGQAHAIAENLLEMSRLETPIVCIVIGEGGSGGALGIGVGDRILMMEHAYYSVISPEGCAAILWKDGDEAPKASEILKLTANDLDGFGVIHEIVPEPLGGAHRDPDQAARALRDAIARHIRELRELSPEEMMEARYEHMRSIGAWLEGGRAPSNGTARVEEAPASESEEPAPEAAPHS